MKKPKQGHTKWLCTIYDPGKVEGYDDRHVALVVRAFVTKVTNRQVHFMTEGRNYYMCSHKCWQKPDKFPTFRKALKYAQQKIADIDRQQYDKGEAN